MIATTSSTAAATASSSVTSSSSEDPVSQFGNRALSTSDVAVGNDDVGCTFGRERRCCSPANPAGPPVMRTILPQQFGHQRLSRSMIVTLACPPPSHIVCRPYPAGGWSSFSSVVISLAPVAPG